MANLDQFITKVKRGMQMAHNFEVQFNSPLGPAGERTRDLSLMCEEVTVPGLTLATNTVFTFGESREVVYNRVFEPATFNFLVDINSTALTFFRDWMDKIIDPNTRMVGYYDTYANGSVIISHTNKGTYTTDKEVGAQQPLKKQNVYQVVLREAYPKAIQAYTLSSNTKDVLRYSVTMNYKYWERQRVDLPPSALPAVRRTNSGGTPR
jgi:hypothetical protein